jgi:ketosteroid isomerase-like protein
MSATENKRLLQEAFAETAKGNGRLFVGLMTDDVTWTIAGGSDWPRHYQGKAAVLGDLLSKVNAQFDGPNRCVADSFLADGDRVVVEAHGLNRTRHGAYENRYCFVFSFRDGRIVAITEYMDTALAEKRLPYADSVVA